MPDDPRMNSPSSGEYGEGADLTNLKKALPQGAVGNPSNQPAPPTPIAPSPSPPLPSGGPPLGRPPGATAPPGVPSVLMAPTNEPDTPVNTPLQGPPMGPPSGAANPQQARMAVLDALAHSPQVSPETREWAQSVMRVLVANTAG